MVTENDLSLNLVISILKQEDCRCSLRWQRIEVHDIQAREFLSFARDDLEDHSERGEINALSNAKRAIDCRMDELLSLFNFSDFASRQGWNAPRKMQNLQTFGVPALDVLKNMITSRRNVLEHEYTRPERQEVRDIVDIAELFIKATDGYVTPGYIASANICVPVAWREPEKRRGDLRGKRISETWIHMATTFGEYEVVFDRENKAVTLTRFYRTEEEAVSSTGGEIQSRERCKGTRQVSSVPLRDCEMKEVREIMMLLRAKGGA